jgi:uncharacterized membrane protein YccC
MGPSAAPTDSLYEASLRQGRVKHAVKTALACCLATGLVYFFHLRSGEFAPVFVFLLMSIGMPTPRLNWLLAQTAIVISVIVSAIILVVFHPAPFLYLLLTLLWIFTCLLFSARFPLPATMGAMVSAIGIFVALHGTVGDTLQFYFAYGLDYVIAGFSVVVVHTLLWPVNTRGVFLQRLAQVYAHLEERCRQAAGRIRSGEPPVVMVSPDQWAPFRELRRLLAPELRRAGETPNPFSRMILACRSLNLRLWFFSESIAPQVFRTISMEARGRLARLLERYADRLHALLEAALQRIRVPPGAALWPEETGPTREISAQLFLPERDVLLAQGIHETVLRRVGRDLGTIALMHNLLVDSLGHGPAKEAVTNDSVVTHKRLVDLQAVRAAAKLVLMITLLLVAEGIIGLPGGAQVAFYATFFASTGNLGRQNKTDLVGLVGLVCGFLYGVTAAFVTSYLPQFPLLLALVFLGEFSASLAFQVLPRYSAAGLQAGLALPFAYLATTGPEWGSFTLAQTRFAGLVIAGCVAIIIHAYLWPVLPIRQLRASIAVALRDTASSLVRLFGVSRATWTGPPASLIETVRRAPDLLDDARYLPGADHADPAYQEILRSLQEIDANLEYLHFLIGLETEHPLRVRFFQVAGDYGVQAQTNLERVAQQFEGTPRHAARLESVRWNPDLTARWQQASDANSLIIDDGIDPSRPAVLAHCLDQIAQQTERISRTAREINLRNAGTGWTLRLSAANQEDGIPEKASVS